MKRRYSIKEKKKLLVVLISAVLAGVLGYVETLIPAVFPAVPYLRVHLSVFFALFAVLAYTPFESILIWGVRSVVYGLVLDDGYAILFELAAGALAAVVVWALRRTRIFGGATMGIPMGIVYAFVYTCLACIVPRSAAPFGALAQAMAFYAVNYLPLGVLAYVALRYLPEYLIFDDKSKV